MRSRFSSPQRRKIHVLHIQGDELRHSDAGGVHQLQHGVVPIALLVHALGLLQKQLHLPAGQDLRAFALHLGGGHALGGAGLHGSGEHQVMVKGLDGGGAAGDGGRRAALVRQVGQILLHGRGLDPAQVAALGQPGPELGQVPEVGADGVGGGVLLLLQIGAVQGDIVGHTRLLLSFYSVRAMTHCSSRGPKVSSRAAPISRIRPHSPTRRQ